MVDICVNTNGAFFGNALVEFVRNDKKATLVGFDDYIFNKFIRVASDTTSVDLYDGTIIDQMNNIPIPHKGYKPFISTPQACDFVVDVHYNSKHNGI